MTMDSTDKPTNDIETLKDNTKKLTSYIKAVDEKVDILDKNSLLVTLLFIGITWVVGLLIIAVLFVKVNSAHGQISLLQSNVTAILTNTTTTTTAEVFLNNQGTIFAWVFTGFVGFVVTTIMLCSLCMCNNYYTNKWSNEIRRK